MSEKLFLKKNSLPIYDFFFSFIMFRTILAPLASVQVIINFEINSALCAAYPCSEEFDLLVFHGKNLDNFTSHVIVLIIRLYIKWLGLVVHSLLCGCCHRYKKQGERIKQPLITDLLCLISHGVNFVFS